MIMMIIPRMKSQDGQRNAFTLTELMVVVAILALLLTILIPSLGKAKDYAYRARCLMHLQALMSAHATYASTYDGALPGLNGIVTTLNPDGTKVPNDPYGMSACLPTETGLLSQNGFVTSPEIWTCPKAKLSCPGIWYMENGYHDGWMPQGWTDELVEKYPYTYHFSYNDRTLCMPGKTAYGNSMGSRNIASFYDPSHTVLLAEENTGMIPYSDTNYQILNDQIFRGPDLTEPRHMGKSQVGYLDGHANQVDSHLQLWVLEEYCPVKS